MGEYQHALEALDTERRKVVELKLRARALYSKYIDEGSIYEINIPFKCRKDIGKALQEDESVSDPLWDEDADLLNLFGIWSKALKSQYQLLSYSFSRFKQNPAYDRLSQIMRNKT